MRGKEVSGSGNLRYRLGVRNPLKSCGHVTAACAYPLPKVSIMALGYQQYVVCLATSKKRIAPGFPAAPSGCCLRIALDDGTRKEGSRSSILMFATLARARNLWWRVENNNGAAWLCKVLRLLEWNNARPDPSGRASAKGGIDYLVGEKLLNFADAAYGIRIRKRASGLVSQVRCIFTADEIREHLARIEREVGEETSHHWTMTRFSRKALQNARSGSAVQDDSELLTSTTLGTS